MEKKISIAGVLLLCVFYSLEFACADGIIIPDPTPEIPKPELAIKYHHVNVSIDNQYAETEIDQVFINPYSRDLEGSYIFPLPEGASIHDFSMFVDGEELKGEILEKEKARQIYEDIVRRLKDPALLEYIDRNTFKARVYPIPANGEKRIKLRYSEIIKCDSGICRYVYPLDVERFSSMPLESVVIVVRIKSREPIKSVYSPTHEISVDRISDYEVEVSYEEESVKPEKDFELYFTLSEEDFGLNLLTYKKGDEDGYFMLMLAPRVEIAQDEIIPKDIIFVLDTSGSMSGKKIERAKNALEFCIENLNEEDRFNVITFNTDVDKFSNEIMDVNSENRENALNFVKEIGAGGGTNINDALLEALKMLSRSDRASMIVFLTDGKPTVGTTNTEKILNNVKNANKNNARIFVFGVGYDVNTHLLDKISQQNSGVSEYITPDEDLEIKISNFFSKINNPILSDLELDFGQINVKNLYPTELPDLFKGSQIIVFGRYENSGDTAITLRGRVDGEEKSFSYDAEFPSISEENDFIPRLWATRRIGYLLEQIRLHGEEKEIVDEIIELSLRYGIITPYTSFLVDVDTEHGRPTRIEEARNLFDQILGATAFKAESGVGAVKGAKTTWELQRTETYQTAERVRVVELKTFYLRDGIWIDNEYSPKKETIKIKYDSETYWNLVRENPEIGKYLSLGRNVRFCIRDKCYEIGEEGIEHGEIEIPTTVPYSTTISPRPPRDNTALINTTIMVAMVIVVCAVILIWNRLR